MPTPFLSQRQTQTRYYVNRVGESLTKRAVKLFCSIFLTILLLVGVISFVVWLALRPHRPRFHVTSFSVPGLNPGTGLTNSPISFSVSDRNPNRNIGIYYDAMKGSVFYQNLRIGGDHLMFPFYQPPQNTTVIHGEVTGAPLTVGDEVWRRFEADVGTGRVGFRLELVLTVRFKVVTWGTNRHVMDVSCDVDVGPDGTILAASKEKRCGIYFH